MGIRVMPRLDIKGPNLVKGVHLEGLRVLGRPEWFAARYYLDGADELIYIDQVASLYGRNNLSEIVSRAAEQLHIPLTVGGGVRSVQDIQSLLRAGADKVAINTAAIKHPALIKEGAHAFGSQCIVLYIEAKRRGPDAYECLTDNARECSGVELFDWVRRAVDLGAGEILLTSVDQEGTGRGYDVELTAKVAGMVDVPVIASGGAGNAQHVIDVIRRGKADAVCAASLFHYAVVDDMRRETQFEEGNTEFLAGKLSLVPQARKVLDPVSIHGLKASLTEAGLPVRQLQRRYEAAAA
jgi:cyclase